MNPYEESQARFMRDTEHHELSVLRDDGLYRHLRLKNPDRQEYWYDIVTWPGYLAIVGDAGDYVFSRLRDMFEFFHDNGYGINPSYWAEKLQAPRGTRAAQTYSEASLRQHVMEWFEQQTGLDPRTGRVPAWRASEEMRRWRGFSRRWRRRQLFLLEGDLPVSEALRLSRQLQSDVLSLAFSEHEAHEALRDFSFDLPGLPKLYIEDSWEWDLRDFEHGFLWCCWAVLTGIQRYETRKAVASEVYA